MIYSISGFVSQISVRFKTGKVIQDKTFLREALKIHNVLRGILIKFQILLARPSQGEKA